MAVFDGVRYALSLSLSPTRRNELAAILDLNGAAPHSPHTHLIVLPASHAHNDATNDPTIKLVTDRWVDRSVVLGKCQPEQYYSADPAMIFSGVVACATGISVADLEVLSAGITALGGQWRIGLTRDVTHLFALQPGSDKYNTALHFAAQTHMYILTPHWFDDSIRLGRRISETPYAWPDPPVLRPGMTLRLDDDAPATEGKRRRKPAVETEVGDSTNDQVRVWADRRILLSTSLELGESSQAAIEAGIRRAGGVVVPIPEDADEDVEEKAVGECDVFITRWRSGKAYFKAARASLLIGTLSWLFSVESSRTLHSPLDSLLWYPTPKGGGIPGLIDCEISVTNYTGAARDYLKRLILLVGAKFTPSMSQSNKVLVAGFQPSPKTTRALSWSIPVVNHIWLEDCIVEWRALTVGLERYIVYPPGIDFGKMLMTRHDEPPSPQSVFIPRLSGGAVPGGRGIGVVDVEKEEMRDAEYRARAREAGHPLAPSATHENDTAADGVSTFRLEGNVATESRARPRSRTDSVKKTPSSSARAKRGLVSTPMTTSAMGMFIDHVIELPADDDVASDKRRTPVNGKQRTPTLHGSRATPRSVSRASSADLFSTGKEVEVVVRHLGSSSKDGTERDKEKGKGKSNTRKRQIPSAEGVDEDDDVLQLAGPPKPKPRLVQQRPDVQTAQTEDEAVKQALAQASKPRRAARGTATSFDSHSYPSASEVEASEVSVPPRKATGTGSMTPVKSGMKPRPRSKSASRPSSVFTGESGDEMGLIATNPGMTTGSGKRRDPLAKPTHSGGVVSREKAKAKADEGRKKETEKITPRPRSPLCSPLLTSSGAKNVRAPKRRLSVLVPPVSKDYFPSQSVRDAMEAEGDGDREHESEKRRTDGDAASVLSRKQLAPAASIHAISAEASMSTSKRGKPHPAKPSTTHTVTRNPEPQSQAKPKPKASVPKTHVNEDDEDADEEKDNATSMTSSVRGGPRRSAANKATARLREKIMPDVISYERERKQAKRRRSENWGLVGSVRGEGEGEERGRKRRKVPREVEEEVVEEAEVEEAVLVPSIKTRTKLDDRPTKNKPSGSEEKKGGRGRGKESAAIRLMTTGVTISDDVIKRLTKLGVQLTTKPTDCTHLIAKGIVRTEKFLCAMSVSPYVLTEEWANASAKSGKLLPETQFLLSDAHAEQKWSFNFAEALARAKGSEGGSRLFEQMTFYVTPKIGVDVKLLKNVVSAGGGQVQTSTMPTARILKGKAKRYVVSCQEDKGVWRPLVQEGFKVYSPELVLRGALRQEIEWEKEECLVAG